MKSSNLRYFLRTILLLVVGYGFSHHALGSSPTTSVLSGHLTWGDCLFGDGATLKNKNLWPVLCFRPNIETEIFIREDRSNHNVALNYANLYSGFHLSEYISIHGEWWAKRYFYLNESNRYRDLNYPESYFLQIGNIALTNWRVTTGKIKSVFGINYFEMMELYRSLFKNESYWNGPSWGSILTYDTLISSQYQISYTTNRFDKNFEDSSLKENSAMAIRMMFDIAALEGFRFVFSGFGEQQGERRISLGFINSTIKGDMTVFEWVRMQNSPDGKEFPFDQIFRMSYVAAYRGGTRAIVEFEDESHDYRMGTIGVDALLPDYGTLRFGISYHDDVPGRIDDFWFLMMGFRLSL